MAVGPTSETITQARDAMVKSCMDIAQMAQAGHLSGLMIVGILTDGRQSVSTVLDGRTHPFILCGATQAHLNQTSDAVLRSVTAQSLAANPKPGPNPVEEVTEATDAATDSASATKADLTPDT